MRRNWKDISNIAMEYGSILLDNPSFMLDSLQGAVVVETGPSASIPPTDFTPRSVRTFLWDNRKSRAVMRDRAVLKVDRNEDEVRVSLGALTHPDAAARLEPTDGV